MAQALHPAPVPAPAPAPVPIPPPAPAAIPVHGVPPPLSPHPTPAPAGGGLVVVFLILTLAYLFPSIRAWMMNHPRKWPILMVNILAGWTIVGYFVALRWSAPKKEAAPAPTPVAVIPAGPRLIQEVQGMSMAPVLPTPAPVVHTAPAPVVSSQDDVDKLAKLGALYEKGLLSAEEFQKAKAKILF